MYTGKCAVSSALLKALHIVVIVTAHLRVGLCMITFALMDVPIIFCIIVTGANNVFFTLSY